MTREQAPAVALAASLVLGAVCTPLARALARRVGLVYRPAADRWSTRPTALLGGVGIAAAAALGALVGLWSMNFDMTPGRAHLALGVASAAGMMFAVGLVDDIIHMRAQLKFVLQLVAGVVLLSSGALIGLTPWYTANVAFTLLWFVAVTNALNLLDNMDGVAAGVGGIAALFLGIAFLKAGAPGAATAAWGLSGAALAFLLFNFHPASVFMGDAGSLFIGASLAGLVAISPSATSGSLISVMFVPLAICGVPLLDTMLVTVTRTLAGRSIAQGGRDHSTHRLVALGLSERQVALLLYAFAVVGGLVALLLTNLARDAALIVGTVFLVSMALLAAWLGRLHVEHPNASRGSQAVRLMVTRLVYRRRLAELMLDVVLVSLAWYAAFRLRFDGAPDAGYVAAFEQTLAVVVVGKILIFAVFGVYRGTWEYASVGDLFRIVGAVLAAAVGLFTVGEVFVPALGRAHSLVYIDALCTGALVLFSRISFRGLELARREIVERRGGQPVLIYGAGDAGMLALREMGNNSELDMLPVCFLDDDARKHGRQIHGVPIEGGLESLALVAERYGVRQIVLGSKKLKPHVVKAVHAFAQRDGIKVVALDLQFRALKPGVAAGPVIAEEPVAPRRSGDGPKLVRDEATGA